MSNDKSIEQAYALAKEAYAEYAVDAEAAINAIGKIPISLHCWQGDDVGGFENPDSGLDGGLEGTIDGTSEGRRFRPARKHKHRDDRRDRRRTR